MGSWGTGLYADDFALDLRESLSGMARLPMDGNEILSLLRADANGAAENPNNDEHSRFWLVVADQFQKRGIPCAEATAKALAIIDSGADVEVLARLGITGANLRKRGAVLKELRARLVSVSAPKPRKVLKKPQHLIMRPGEVFVYPTSGGAPYNPYITPATRERFARAFEWKADGWGAMLILKAEVAYGYLTWYLPLVVRKELAQKPTLAALKSEPWTRQNPGTCSQPHFKRLGLELIGSFSMKAQSLESIICSAEDGASAALRDISIANGMDVASDHPNQNRHIQGQLNRQPAIDFAELIENHHGAPV